jgi:hypothetical protein
MQIPLVTIKNVISSFNGSSKLDTRVALVSDPMVNALWGIYESDFNIQYPTKYKLFIVETCGVKLEWSLNNDDDIGFVKGTISTLGPEEMIQDSKGGFWKGIFWFDEVKSELNDRLKRFVPFDLADGFNYVTGFLKEGNDTDGWVIGEQLYLNIENEELIPHPFTFDEYLEFILKTKGYHNFLGYYNKPESDEYKRFMRVMPLIFEDFDKEYFIKLSHKS